LSFPWTFLPSIKTSLILQDILNTEYQLYLWTLILIFSLIAWALLCQLPGVVNPEDFLFSWRNLVSVSLFTYITLPISLTLTPWKNNCHLISSDITQLCLQLQSYCIPTLNLILVFLMFILKKISKKWVSSQRSLQQSSACSAVQLIANFGAVQGSGWPGAWHLLWHCSAPIVPKFRDPHEIDQFSLKLRRIYST
jgi:hypothetical protein